ncbi:CLUMA_CG003171, isoform A [Clunio marinus]|uniref:CLUMA_CG003171, isoform A n=1 Tax=Clunio marinus TaxID=568069 RepID=A0A1J1HSG7_9DIPT|nr:CLUMA_CG003171, isoform A [Clunio marinus]
MMTTEVALALALLIDMLHNAMCVNSGSATWMDDEEANDCSTVLFGEVMGGKMKIQYICNTAEKA